MFNKNLFTPLEELNKKTKEPLKKIETKINELEFDFVKGKDKLKTEVNKEIEYIVNNLTKEEKEK